MSSVKSLLFSHNHHLLSVKGCEAGLDVLAFEGDEALSQPFRYRIEFTSADHAISKEMMLMKAASLTLQAPVAQGFGINVQQPVRVIQGVVTGFERLSTSRDETHYALTLQPRLALLNRSHQNAIYQDQSVPQIVEKILRERHGLRGQDFLFSLTKTYPRREQVMQTIHHLNKDLGITVVSITHYMEEAAQADRVLVMSQGNVVMEGTPKEVFSQTEKVRSLRLDVPQAAELRDELVKAGIPMPEGIIDTGECAQALYELLK